MKNILITGTPGVGKTTLVKKILDALKTEQIEFDGFYTEEIRAGNSRIGFDIVTSNGKRAILARKSSTNDANLPKLGQYVIHVEEFERTAFPIFDKLKGLLIIDEIGKMELFSQRFETFVRGVFDNSNIRVLATVPLKGPLLVRQLKERQDCHIVTVDTMNRNGVLSDIIGLLGLTKNS